MVDACVLCSYVGSSSTPSYHGLPPDILLRIAGILGPRDKLSLAFTCRRFLWLLYSGTVSVYLDPPVVEQPVVPPPQLPLPPPQPWWDQGG